MKDMATGARLLVAPFLLILLLGSAGQLYAAEYYVSKAGADSSAGTKSNPWKTIGKANSTLRAGDTVFIRGGEYKELIRPGRSGSAGSYITYSSYLGETVVITNVSSPFGRSAIVLDDRSYIKIQNITVDGKKLWPNANLDSWAELNNARYNVIQNSTFKYANGWAGIRLSGSSKYNKILNNTMDGLGTLDDGGVTYGDMIVIIDPASSNLIEGNTLTRGGHNLLTVKSSNNIIRGNSFDNGWTASTGYRAVTLSARTSGIGRNVFEDNVVKNVKSKPNDLNGKGSPEAIKVEGSNQIVRRNYIFTNAQEAFMAESRVGKALSINNKIYHNTIYNNGAAAWSLREFDGGIAIVDNIFKNNLVFRNRQSPVSSNMDNDIVYLLRGKLGNNQAISNAMMVNTSGDAKVGIQGSDKLMNSISLPVAESRYTNAFEKNLDGLNPQFVVSNPTNKEGLQLRPTSSLVDAGSFLTTTTSAGFGKTIPVDDAGYFIDGFGVTTGDLIQIGSNAPVLVTKVDYAGKFITVDKAVSWNKGDGVSLSYGGSAPDIGAYENDVKAPAPPTPPQFL